MVSPQLYIMITDLFKTPTYKSELNLNLSKIKNYCLDFQKQNIGREYSNVGGWQSYDLIGEHKPLNDLFVEIEKHGNLFSKQINLGKVFLDNIWININEHKNYNASHIHDNSVLSGVYYVDVPEKSGNLLFEHPSIHIKKEWKHMKTDFEIISNNNFLHIFPSWLPHSVQPNMSGDVRISISFNLGLTNE